MSREHEPRTLLVLSAPTGTGKTTIAHRLVDQDGTIAFSVSHTTRSPRPGERDGEDYHFVTEEAFRAIAAEGEFLEWAHVHGNLYGTHRSEADAAFARGKSLLLDIDVQGGLQVREAFPEALLVFILPPSLEALLRRLEGRKEENHFNLRRRLGTALRELELAGSYDYTVCNEDLDHAVRQVRTIVEASRLRLMGGPDGIDRLRREIASWLRSSDVHSG